MLAKIKTTGKVYKVLQFVDDPADSNNRYVSLLEVDPCSDNYGSASFSLDEVELINDSDMPSENRMRYELAKAAMQGILANPNRSMIDMTIEETSSLAIKCADEAIKQLKESKVNHE